MRLSRSTLIALALLIGCGLSLSPAWAGYTVTLQQVGSNVVATGSGAIDLTGLTLRFPAVLVPFVYPSAASIITGDSTRLGAEFMGTISGPANFGSGGLIYADSGTGDLAGVSLSPSLDVIFVPDGYTNDTFLSDSATYVNATFSSLGVTPGTYEWTWGTGPDQNFTLQVATSTVTVTITTADIRSDDIEVVLTPTNASGTLRLTVVSDTNGEIQLFNGPETGGSHTFRFNPQNLPVGHYDAVRATWTVNGTASQASKDIAFFVLGRYRHSQYNTPLESTCVGDPAPAYITDDNCNASSTTLISGFITQVNLNGSGRSTLFGDVVREAFCHVRGGNHRSFRQTIIRPTCEGLPLDDNTVARNPDHQYLDCGDQILIVGLGNGTGTIKTVTDECPVCPESQLDNYTTDPACSKIRDLGRFVTIRLR